MKIYHFILDPRGGGPHVYVKTVSDLLKDEFDFETITSGFSENSNLSLFNFRFFWRPLYFIAVIVNVLYIIFLRFTGKIDKKSLFDVHSASNIAPVIAASLLRIPLVWHFHESVNLFKVFVKFAEFFLFNLPVRYVAVSSSVITTYQLNGATLIYPSVDSNFWCENKLKIEKGKELRIVNVAYINPLKGQDILIDAALLLNMKFSVELIGPRLTTHQEYNNFLDKKMKAISSQGNEVVFQGFLNATEIKERLANCDVFVLPSRSEASPIALLEAMSMGCICIASAVGGVHEIISDSSVGFLFSPENAEDLSQKLELVSSMSDMERQQMRTNARNHVLQNFSLATMKKQHLSLYQQLSNPN